MPARPMFANNLRLRISLYLMLALSPAAVALPFLLVAIERDHLHAEIARRVTQIAELVVKSTRHTMLMNEPEMAAEIVDDIGKLAGVQRIRLLTSDGTIMHSMRAAEVGSSLGRQQEPCVRCHETAEPLARVPDDQRWRIYEDADGQRLLAAMEPIRNEPTCSSASCHEHPASQSVLGVVDIAYSLTETDQVIHRHVIFIFALSVGLVLVAASAAGLMLQRLVYLPLKDLDAGARKLAGGDLDHPIPVRGDDEFGRLAGTFNQMGARLKESLHELQELVHTLEQKVDERTAELRVAQAEVAHGEKLASIGMLASGIAHELNNPLTGILTFTSLLREKMPEGSADAEDLDLVIRETKRCAAIIRRLLDFAREKVPAEGFVDLEALLQEVIRLVFNPATAQRIQLELRLAGDLPKVFGDADLIKQVVMNILVNATQAIADRGKIVVETRRIDPSGPEGRTGAAPMVEFSIADTGCGMPQDHLQRIFDPFFTTKEVGKGTGLGLSVSYGIVKAHGGEIKVESQPGVGSSSRVLLRTAVPHVGRDGQEPGESS